MHNPLNDLRYAMRQLRKSPGFAVTVVLTLALGIGANAAIFTMFDQVLLRLLPVEKPKELVRFYWKGSFSGSASSFGGDMGNYFSYPMYKDLRDQNQVFTGMIAADRAGAGISWNNQADNEDVEIVSGNYFQVLGLKPALGRLMTQEDDSAPNANFVVVLSYNYWRTRFGSDRSVVGKTVLINGHPFTIIGVGPQNFYTAIGSYRPQVFLPLSMVDVVMPWTVPRENLTNHKSLWLTLVARRKPGITMATANASLSTLWHALRRQELTLYAQRSQRFIDRYVEKATIDVVDDSQGFSPARGDLKTPLVILLSMAGLLVAMCVINVAALLLLRSARRAREMAMRYALGARRGRIVSQLMLEGGVLGSLGAVLGLVLAPAVASALVRLLTNSDPGSEPYSATVDTRILLFTLAVAVAASLLFSVAPVLHFIRPDLAGNLRQSTGTLSKESQRFRKLAVGAQIVLSVILLGGAGLFVRTLDNLTRQPVGFQADHVETFSLDPTISGYGEARTQQVEKNVLDAVRATPGVLFAAGTTDPVLSGDSTSSGFKVQGYQPKEDENMDFEDASITPDYFATLRQPQLAGREFTVADGSGAPNVAVVNKSFAMKFYGSPQSALGRQIGEGDKPDTTIVGVVGDAKHQDLRSPIVPSVYRPYAQMKHPVGLQIYVRTSADPERSEGEIRRVVHQVDPTLVVDGLRTMDAQVTRTASDEKALATLAVGFSILAMVLSAVGLYGVLAYSTEQRTREIGVRLALGAQRSSVVILILREMLIIAAIAVLVALPSTVALARLFRSQLFGVATFDPIALAAALGLTVLMVFVAAALPARRAAAVEPMHALRTE